MNTPEISSEVARIIAGAVSRAILLSNKEFVTFEEAAELLGMAESTLHRYKMPRKHHMATKDGEGKSRAYYKTKEVMAMLI